MNMHVGLVPIVRPLFRGARMGLQESSRQALAVLGDELGFVLSYTPDPVSDADRAQAVAREAEARSVAGTLDFLLLEHITFATGDLIAPLLEVPVPMGIWALPEVATTGPLPQNALCGLNLSLSLPVARATPVKWFYGGADHPAFRSRLAVTLRALRGAGAVQRGRVLWIGGTAPGFTRLESLPDLPVQVDRQPLDVVFDAIRDIDDTVVAARLESMTEPSAIAHDDLRGTVRVELALGALSQGYDAVALRCWPEIPDRAGVQTCSAYARLADRGRPFACEGDAAGVISMLATAAVTGQPAILLDLSHAADDGLLFWHCGNAARAWASSGRTRLDLHFNRRIPAVRDMRLAPGPVSGLRFLEHRKAVVYAGEVLDRTDGFDGVSGWIGHLRWRGQTMSPDGFLASVLNHRLPHHLIWGRGDEEASLLEMCGWLGHEPLPPDPESTKLIWTHDRWTHDAV